MKTAAGIDIIDTAADFEDLNAIYFATAKQMILVDRCSAKIKLGLNDETIDVIQRMTPSQMSAICKSSVPQFRLFVPASVLENAARTQQSHASKAWMLLSRESCHAVA